MPNISHYIQGKFFMPQSDGRNLIRSVVYTLLGSNQTEPQQRVPGTASLEQKP